MRAAVVVLALIGSAPALAAPTKGQPHVPGAPVTVLPHAAQPFLYAGYFQMTGTSTSGAGGMMKQGDPGLAAGDFHTLAEIAVMSADAKQIVEIGWTVDRQVNGDVHPRLFVFHWVDGAPTCYNMCGWVQVSTTMRPGMRVEPGAMAAYAIELRGADWWLSYQGEDVGYFPGALWPAPFTTGGVVQWFGEIAAGMADSCSEMGNGSPGSNPAAAAMTGLYLIAPGGAHVAAMAAPGEITRPSYWSVGQTTPDSFAFGGPGAPFGCCTPGTCADSVAVCGTVPDACGPALACGGCTGMDVCDDGFQCGLPPDPEPDGEPAPDDAGCCSTGEPVRALPPMAALAFVLRRRRRW